VFVDEIIEVEDREVKEVVEYKDIEIIEYIIYNNEIIILDTIIIITDGNK
jgi:hypothetical protein